MKRWMMLALCFMLTLSLTACTAPTATSSPTAQPTEAPATQAPTATPEPTEAPSAEPTQAPDAGESASGKTLVVYYSATGNTQAVANMIAEATGADVFELEPAQPYTDGDLNWTDENSRVVYEHDHPDDRNVELVSAAVDNWDSYDTVFIGYPIWWGIAAWPVDGFVTGNDFTGKTVIPFATSGSSGMGQTNLRLQPSCPASALREGKVFKVNASREELAAWARG